MIDTLPWNLQHMKDKGKITEYTENNIVTWLLVNLDPLYLDQTFLKLKS